MDETYKYNKQVGWNKSRFYNKYGHKMTTITVTPPPPLPKKNNRIQFFVNKNPQFAVIIFAIGNFLNISLALTFANFSRTRKFELVKVNASES